MAMVMAVGRMARFVSCITGLDAFACKKVANNKCRKDWTALRAPY
jgi:hypothetical protein